MSIDAPPIYVEGAGFFRRASAGKQQPPLGLIEIVGTKLFDGLGLAVRHTLLCRIVPFGRIPQMLFCQVARLVGCEDAIATDGEPPAAAVLVTVLHQERLRAARL